jgi:hypothetical protein
MKANLHLHSRFSDGSVWPEDIAVSAAREGLQLAALTDHDTMGGVERFVRACSRVGIRAIPACEIDVAQDEPDYKSELLVYYPSGHGWGPGSALGRILDEVLIERRKRIEAYLTAAREIFSRDDLNFEDIKSGKLAGCSTDTESVCGAVSWNKVDFYLYLQARHAIPGYLTYKKFKKEWFSDGRLPKYKLKKPSVAEIVTAAKADGAVTSIPHFGHLWDDDLDAMVGEEKEVKSLLNSFREMGVEAVELYWYGARKKSEAINMFVRSLAEPMGYFFTYGSDCHGPGTEKYTINKFSGDFGGFSDGSLRG